jgi:hypothetical protein
MDQRDREQFARIMYGLADNFGAELSEPGLQMRFEALREYSMEQVIEAARRIALERKYTKMPTIAEFLEYLHGGHVEDRAQAEAGKVMDAVRRHGAYASVVFDNPVTMASVERLFGGWPELCRQLRETDWRWFVRAFTAMYSSFSRQEVKRYGRLPGILEGSTGQALVPALVGDREQARRVLSLSPDGDENQGEARAALDLAMGRTEPGTVSGQG